MKKIITTLILSALFFSCNLDHLHEVLKTSKNPELDMVYCKVIKSEMGKLGSSIAIIDRSIDTISAEIDEFRTCSNFTNKAIYWNKLIFPSAKYISGDSLFRYKNGQTEKYWDLRKKYKAGWIELTSPIFTRDKKKVIIQVTYFRGTSFGTSSYYILELINGEYHILKKKLIFIS